MKKVKTLTDDQIARVSAVNYDFDSFEKVQVVDCDLCGCERFTILSKHDRYQHQVCSCLCDSCGNLFISPRLTASSASVLYEKYYRPLVSAYHGRTIDKDTLQVDQHIYSDELLADFDHFGVRERNISSVLDIGGSTGVILKRFDSWYAKQKLKMINIDPASNEASVSHESGIETIRGMFETHDFKHQKFDLILMCQTIDHLESISQSFAKVHQLLSESGLFFVDYVDVRKIIERDGSLESAIKIDHNYHLTGEVVEAYLTSSGLEIQRKIVQQDKHHVGYICSKSSPALPDFSVLRSRKVEFYNFVRSLREEFDG